MMAAPDPGTRDGVMPKKQFAKEINQRQVQPGQSHISNCPKPGVSGTCRDGAARCCASAQLIEFQMTIGSRPAVSATWSKAVLRRKPGLVMDCWGLRSTATDSWVGRRYLGTT
jgi:hypothetical protein